MAARASLGTLIKRVRYLIGDPTSALQYWDDETVQFALDDYRNESLYEVLTPAPTPAGGSLSDQYLDYYSPNKNWEDDVTLWDSTFAAPLAPVVSENTIGHWTFAAPGNNPPIYARGKTYDLYAAAADLLEQRLADPNEGITFTTEGGATFQLHEIRDSLEKRLAKYRALAEPKTTRIFSSEDQPDYLSNTGPGGGYYAP